MSEGKKEKKRGNLRDYLLTSFFPSRKKSSISAVAMQSGQTTTLFL